MFLIFKIWINPPIQNKIKRTSVLNKNEDKLTDGNKKKVNAQQVASNVSLNNFFEKIKIKYEETQYKVIGIIFNTKKLSSKTIVTKRISQDKSGGFE